ncbi:MAG TPA: flagellar hook-length control protein FliK [Solirubrobacteraceae bacterium]|nr:flagellar hook-length control protein FliK [Solirubrobacteraceae bacterium]
MPVYGARLAQAAATVSDAIAFGSRNGVSIARIQLEPASLGSIQIHLQHTDGGLVARVVTAHPEAAETLMRSSDDLRQSLAQSGATLLRLDIHSSDGRRSGPERQGAQEQAAPRRPAAAGGAGDGDQAGAEAHLHQPRGLTGATLVDLLA